MRFGAVPPAEAEGATLAHSLAVDGLRLKKGRRLSAADVAALAAAGVAEVTVARLDPGDLGEDAGAEAIAAGAGARPGAGRPLGLGALHRTRQRLRRSAGILSVDRLAIDALNRVDPAITVATLPDGARVRARQMLATVKIIPYAVPADAVAAAAAAAGPAPLRLHGFRPGRAALILTRAPGSRDSLLAKGAEAVAARLAALGQAMAPPVTVPHEAAAVAAAIRAAPGGLVLILGASATSDAADVAPAGLVAAGGRLLRFGMPVDPGNLLFIGEQAGRPVVGLPGCARSPALNGADWVLERLAAGLPVGAAEIAAMGVGGLLKEIPIRPQPRQGAAAPPGRPRVAAIVLAAGAARRMRGRDKLLEPVAGRPALRAAVEAALASRADTVAVVLQPGAGARRAALAGLDVRLVEAPDWAEGMAASLRAGLAAVAAEADAAVILLADMPEVGAAEIDRLIAAFDPAEGREICRAVSVDGVPGHPVLIGRRFFESLAALTGDRGAREVLRDAADFVVEVPTAGRAAVDRPRHARGLGGLAGGSPGLMRRLRRIVLILLGVAIAATLALAFHHPPMRLMPPPLIFQDGAIIAALGIGAEPGPDTRLGVFYATNRLPVGPRDDRIYTVAPDRSLHLGEATLRIGDEDTPWERLLDWSTGTGGGERPFIHLERMNETGDARRRRRARPGDRGLARRDRRGAGREPRRATSSSTCTAPTPPSSAPPGRRRSCGTSPGGARWWCSSPGRPPRTSCATRATSRPRSAARRTSPT